MSIRVRFFASLRERLEIEDREIPPSGVTTVADVWRVVLGETPVPANILVAVNMDYVDFTATVRAGDEVAFFPPVTGG